MNDQAEPWGQPALPRPIALESRPLYRGQSRGVVSGSLPRPRTLTDSRVCGRHCPPQLGEEKFLAKISHPKSSGYVSLSFPRTPNSASTV